MRDIARMTKRLISAADRATWDGSAPKVAVQCYWSEVYRKRDISVLRSRARYLVDTTYMFKHWDEYLVQKHAETNEEKGDVYWTAEYYEKPMDQIRIIAAVENQLKAMLLAKGYMVHYIRREAETRHLYDKQEEGDPVRIADFLAVRSFYTDIKQWKPLLEGLHSDLKTLSITHLLGTGMTSVLGLDERFVHLLKKIQKDRNRVHFMIDQPGAHNAERYLDDWGFVRECCSALVRQDVHMIAAPPKTEGTAPC